MRPRTRRESKLRVFGSLPKMTLNLMRETPCDKLAAELQGAHSECRIRIGGQAAQDVQPARRVLPQQFGASRPALHPPYWAASFRH